MTDPRVSKDYARAVTLLPQITGVSTARAVVSTTCWKEKSICLV